jgi:hypothetical protein
LECELIQVAFFTQHHCDVDFHTGDHPPVANRGVGFAGPSAMFLGFVEAAQTIFGGHLSVQGVSQLSVVARGIGGIRRGTERVHRLSQFLFPHKAPADHQPSLRFGFAVPSRRGPGEHGTPRLDGAVEVAFVHQLLREH